MRLLILRAPQIVLHALEADEHHIEVPRVARLRSTTAQSSGKFHTELQNFRHQRQMLSWVTTMPRSARISSTARRLRLSVRRSLIRAQPLQPFPQWADVSRVFMALLLCDEARSGLGPL